MSTSATSISNTRPDHPSLDFELLRSEGLRHLENLATEAWTDFNAHDPGITILELLCYALTDLGYRTRMISIADIMSPGPDKKKTWFEAPEILPMRPITERDFRKLLIDVKGVKNAWLCKGEGEMPIYWISLVFPQISNTAGDIDDAKLKDFVKQCNKGLAGPDLENFKTDLNNYITAYQENLDAYYIIQPYLLTLTQLYGSVYNLLVSEMSKILKENGSINKPDYEIEIIARSIIQRLQLKKTSNNEYPSDIALYINEGLIVDYPPTSGIGNDADSSFDHFLNKIISDFLLKNIQNVDTKTVSDFLTFIQNGILPDIDSILYEPVVDFFNKYDNFEGYLGSEFVYYLHNRFNINDAQQLDYLSDQLVFYFKAKDYLEYVHVGYGEFFNQSIHAFLHDQFELFKHDATDATKAIEKLFTQYLNNQNNINNSSVEIKHCFGKLFCTYGIYNLTLNTEDVFSKDSKDEDKIKYLPYHQLHLNGLYRIVLDLDDDIDPEDPKQSDEIVQRAMKRLHANRSLCEDFLQPFVVEKRPLHICLNLDLAPDADEQAVVAEVIWRFQEYLTPSLQFYSFKQRQEQGIPCDLIYNGPLLDNGFLDDDAVDASKLRDVYYHSDLIRIANETPGVLGVHELKINKFPEKPGNPYAEEAVYQVKDTAGGSPGNCTPPFVKRVIEICDSCFYVNKGAVSFQLSEEAIEEQYKWLMMTRNCAFCNEPGGQSYPGGLYHADLADYRSIQYDLPTIYTVGEYTVPTNATPLRKAQAKQLQAYLAFFDQIFASYLAQLGQVKNLLAVEQHPEAASYILPALYEIPGLRDLIETKASFNTIPADWLFAIAKIVPEPERNAVKQQLNDWVSAPANFEGFLALHDALSSKLSTAGAAYIADFENHFWEKYLQDDKNSYISALQEAAEDPAVRQKRRNSLLKHLIARFGESFNEYILALLRPDAEPEDTPWREDFELYLQDKAKFLLNLPALGGERGKGYDYRKINKETGQPDVWNTDNVAGVQKRVSSLTGIEDWNGHSLISEPAYRLDINQSQNNQGLAQFRIVLRKRFPTPGENPEQSSALLFSRRFHTKKLAQEKANELYLSIWKPDYYMVSAVEGQPEDFVVQFFLKKPDGSIDVQLTSDQMGEEEAQNLLQLILDIVKPGKGVVEGLHLIEHILLRPNDKKDWLLQIPMGCDPAETPVDPYSFWISVILPGWTPRFKNADFRYFFEQTFRKETPAHIAIRFCWVDLETMYKFEPLYKKWMEEKAKCNPNECHVTDAANDLLKFINALPCSCACDHDQHEDKCKDCNPPETLQDRVIPTDTKSTGKDETQVITVSAKSSAKASAKSKKNG